MKRLEDICQIIFNFYEAYTVAVYKREGDFLRCMSFLTLSKNFSGSRLLPIDETLPGWVVKHREPLIIPNFDKETETLGYYERDEDIKSFMGYPVEGNGVICIDSKKKYSFTDKEKKNLKSFVPLILQEIGQDDKGSDFEERLNELNTKHFIFSIFKDLLSGRVTIQEVLNETLRISGADMCFIGMEDKGKLKIKDAVGLKATECLARTCPIGESIASSVIESGSELLLPFNTGYLKEKPLIYLGETFQARQFFGFPLFIDDVVFGVAGFASLGDHPLSEESIRTLRDISVMLSLYYSALWSKEYLERLKGLDPLTGALQFHYFLRIGEDLIKKKTKFGLIMVKLLKLNVFNREKGLDFTDDFIRRAYHLIKHTSGEASFVARKGGGRFYVILPRRDPQAVKNLVRMIEYTLFKGIYENYDGKTKFSKKEDGVYSRVAFFPEDGVELCTLLEKTDA